MDKAAWAAEAAASRAAAAASTQGDQEHGRAARAQGDEESSLVDYQSLANQEQSFLSAEHIPRPFSVHEKCVKRPRRWTYECKDIHIAEVAKSKKRRRILKRVTIFADCCTK